MKNINTHKQTTPKDTLPGKQYSYGEIIEFLDSHWAEEFKDKSLATIQKLDKAFGSLSQKIKTILITGTNGKSLTAHFVNKLLKEEGLNVGTFYAPHLLTYNERLTCGNELIQNKLFTDIATEVLTTAESLDIVPHSLDMLTIMALRYFEKSNVDVAIIELSDFSTTNPTMILSPLITAITRITDFEDDEKGMAHVEKVTKDILSTITKNTHVVSADQSKHNLLYMQKITESKGAIWAMPIRKLATLPYPFEQLHGRCAALAERVANIYINSFTTLDAVIVSNSLLTKQQGQRGRPTLEAKRHAELNPKRTVEQFWKETENTLPGRFQLLDKEKPSILLDNASNLDAFENVLLGIRLLHYHRPLKGLTLILGNNNPDLNYPEFFKMLRYFFKKTSGQVIVCPAEPIPGHEGAQSWDAEKVTNDLKSMKIKAKSAQNFKEAFEAAQQSVDERNGLVVITGSSTIVSHYWRYKGMKKI
jgi:Folylpolyglutamate synthase